MAIKIIDLLATVFLHLVHCSYGEHILYCNVTAIEPCPDRNHFCKQTTVALQNLATGECYCRTGFKMDGERCVAIEDDNGSTGSATTAVLVIFTLALVICGLVLVVRKYHLLDYVRQRINLRRNNDVMYEDVMIGQDDPPLSP